MALRDCVTGRARVGSPGRRGDERAVQGADCRWRRAATGRGRGVSRVDAQRILKEEFEIELQPVENLPAAGPDTVELTEDTQKARFGTAERMTVNELLGKDHQSVAVGVTGTGFFRSSSLGHGLLSGCVSSSKGSMRPARRAVDFSRASTCLHSFNTSTPIAAIVIGGCCCFLPYFIVSHSLEPLEPNLMPRRMRN